MIMTPWTLRIGDGENGADDVGYIEAPHPQGYSCKREVAVVYGMDDNAEAARLITAAPELLDALKAFCGDMESLGGSPAVGLQTAYRHALTVIAKVESSPVGLSGAK